MASRVPIALALLLGLAGFAAGWQRDPWVDELYKTVGVDNLQQPAAAAATVATPQRSLLAADPQQPSVVPPPTVLPITTYAPSPVAPVPSPLPLPPAYNSPSPMQPSPDLSPIPVPSSPLPTPSPLPVAPTYYSPSPAAAVPPTYYSPPPKYNAQQPAATPTPSAGPVPPTYYSPSPSRSPLPTPPGYNKSPMPTPPGYNKSPMPSPRPSPVPYYSPVLPAYLPSPMPYYSPSPRAIPITAFAPGPVPTPASWAASPAPAPAPAPGTVSSESLCTGLSYDGSLSGCVLWFDAAGNGAVDASDAQTLIANGALDLAATTEQMGPAYIIPAPSTDFGKAFSAADTCQDLATGMTVVLPLATPKPPSCSASLSVSPVSSLLVYGKAVGLTEAELKMALGLDERLALGQYNAFKAAASGDALANDLVVAEINTNTIVTLYSMLYAKNPAAFVKVSRAYFEALAAAAKRSADTGAGRRRLLSAGTLDLTSAQALQQLVIAFLQSAGQKQLSAGSLYTPDPAVVEVVTNAVSALNSVAASSPSALSMQQTVVDAMAELAAKIQALVNGSMSVEQFLGSTKSGGYLAASGSAPAAGGSAAAAAGGQSGSNAGVIAGAVVGSVLGACLLAGVVVFIRRRRNSTGGVSTWHNAAADNKTPLISS